uniref:Cytochrome b5 heme-binding domain-containing protein n=1 Tax=Leersia perrieri TaxID=77586 RepID=A0A0D9XCM8_9ORYZ
MEVIVVISLIMLLVLGAFFVITRPNNNGKGKETQSPNSGKKSRSYTMKEISTHNKRKDCWIIINDKVYDVTSYVEEHPGGDEILNNAGGDSTEGFLGPQHGPRVFDIIEDFCIGKLKN